MSEKNNLWQEDATSRDLRSYLDIARRPLVLASGLILFLYLLSLISFLEWSKSSLNYFSWFIILVLLLLVCFRVARFKYKELSHAATTGVIIGLAIGLWHAILQTIWFWSWWMLADLILEPVAVAVAGLFLGAGIAKIIKIKNKSGVGEKSGSDELSPLSADSIHQPAENLPSSEEEG